MIMLNLDSLNVTHLTAETIDTGTLDANKVTIRDDLNNGGFIQIDGTGMTVNNGSFDTFDVSIDGAVTMTSALIQSAAGYPKVVMDPANQLFGAYKESDDYIEIDADFTGSPSINVYENGAIRGQISSLSQEMRISGSSGLNLVSSGDVEVTPGSSNHLRVGTFAKIYGTTEGKDLLTALGEKVDTTFAFSTYAVNMTFDPGSRNLKLFAGNGTQIAIVNIP